jgi:hypothetical protein
MPVERTDGGVAKVVMNWLFQLHTTPPVAQAIGGVAIVAAV